MAGYLDSYGAGEERREKILWRLVLSALMVAMAAGVLYFLFKNYRQEQQAKRFFTFLQHHDYKNAYTLWGCTDERPCRDYPFDRFLEDWGPRSARADIGDYRLRRSRSCGSGVILTVDFGKNQEEKLWVERADLTIGFPPWPGCPALR